MSKVKNRKHHQKLREREKEENECKKDEQSSSGELAGEKERKNCNQMFSIIFKSIRFTILTQITFRLITFLSKIYIVQHLNKEILETVFIRLTLLYSLIVTLSREPIRQYCLKEITIDVDEKKKRMNNIQLIINISWLPIFIGIIISSIFLPIWWFYVFSSITTTTADSADLFYYNKLSIIIFIVAAIGELLQEPLSMILRYFDYVKLMIIVESIATLLQTAINIFLPLYFWNHQSFQRLQLIILCSGQLFYSLSLPLVYYLYFLFVRDKERPFPFFRMKRTQLNKNYLPKDFWGTWFALLRQNTIKIVLEESEKIFMITMNTFSAVDQTLYEIISNLASIVARYIFRPIEEHAFVAFALITGKMRQLKNENHVDELSRILYEKFTKIERALYICGLVCSIYACTYANLLLRILFQYETEENIEKMTYLLRCFVIYLTIIGLNGLSESFVRSSIENESLKSYQRVLFIYSMIFLGTTYIFVHFFSFGIESFIFANSIVMIFRLLYNLRYIINYFKENIRENFLIDLFSIQTPLLIATILISLFLYISHREMTILTNGYQSVQDNLFYTKQLNETQQLTRNEKIIYNSIYVLIGGLCFFIHLFVAYDCERETITVFKKDQ
ncbi:hypothetical protein SNEBB_003449 [Seison nebaliae]|nr:hypothetical protein SNEBB_003449 [Seison nebaliae]